MFLCEKKCEFNEISSLHMIIADCCWCCFIVVVVVVVVVERDAKFSLRRFYRPACMLTNKPEITRMLFSAGKYSFPSLSVKEMSFKNDFVF